MAMANDLLNQFKENQNAWLTVPAILSNSQNMNSKFLSLQILDEAVKVSPPTENLQSRWQILADSDKAGIRNELVQQVLNFPEVQSNEAQFLLTKLNATLISIVKFEWRTSWQSFIPDICNHARQSENKCENALNILRMMSEEIFDFSKNQILQEEVSALKLQMNDQFQGVYDLCYWVLGQACQGALSDKAAPGLVKSCLRTLQVYLSWIPLNFIFQTDLIENLLRHFIVPFQSRNEAIKCFTEVSSLTFDELEDAEANACREKLCIYFCNFIQQISETTKGRSL